jgi:hypothetical protein
MAQNETNNANNGFSLPAPADKNAPIAGGSVVTTTTETSSSNMEVGGGATVDTSSRDLLVGGGILLVLFVAFFFAKNAYANSLVGRRVPPTKANAAGWWLFVFLACLATGVVLSVVSSVKFLTPLIMGPLGLVGLVALVLSWLSGRK